ncbi:MAG: endo-1,4-beta-xylanase [Rhizomicrobium sp.]
MIYKKIATLLLLVGLTQSASYAAPASLQDAYRGAFYVGAAINAAQSTGTDKAGDAIVLREFNTVSPENALKWESIHPAPGRYDFSVTDKYVDFAVAHHMYTVGHVLVWHQQTPDWVFQDAGKPVSRDVLLKRLHDHIFTVVGRYKGKIKSWDVVNEALNDDGSLRPSPWLKIIGEEYIAIAFQYAHEADPAAELTYNDYTLEIPAKRAGALALIKKLKAAGVPVTTVGMQSHDTLSWPSAADTDAAITDFGKLGVKVAITELDVDVLPRDPSLRGADITVKMAQSPALNPYAGGLSDLAEQQLASRYAELFAIYYRHRAVVNRVTFWGVTDAGTWLNDWPIHGRTNYPLLFNRDGSAKIAYDAVMAVPKP